MTKVLNSLKINLDQSPINTCFSLSLSLIFLFSHILQLHQLLFLRIANFSERLSYFWYRLFPRTRLEKALNPPVKNYILPQRRTRNLYPDRGFSRQAAKNEPPLSIVAKRIGGGGASSAFSEGVPERQSAPRLSLSSRGEKRGETHRQRRTQPGNDYRTTY